MNVTGVNPTTDAYLTLWQDGLARPIASNLNPAAGQIVADASITGIGGVITGFDVFNIAGYIDVVLDVVGTFEPPSSPNPPGRQQVCRTSRQRRRRKRRPPALMQR
jgi:hypothetical protein